MRMKNTYRSGAWRGAIAIVAVMTCAVPFLQNVPRAQGAAQGVAEPSDPVDGGWPRAYLTPTKAQMMIYQPQIASWDGRRQMVAYAAASYQAPGAASPSMGTVKVESQTSVSLDDRLVKFSPVRVSETNFPALSREQVQDLLSTIESGIPDEERLIALDLVLAHMDQSQIVPRNVQGVKADPPTIFYSTRTAVLVNFDGEPIWSPITDNDLKFAVNTNWDVFEHGPSKMYYLRHERVWLKAGNIKGPWSAAGPLPDSFAKLPRDDNWKDATDSLPSAPVRASSLPAVFVSTMPAELILMTGAPAYTAVAGTRLLWISNTESDIFRLGPKGELYYLVSGRWFSAPDFTGPWTFATLKLPADFAKISLEHPRSRVLASVPGTPQAAEAVLLAQVPQTARVNRKQLKGRTSSTRGSLSSSRSIRPKSRGP
jgi:hypothetical protein